MRKLVLVLVLALVAALLLLPALRVEALEGTIVAANAPSWQTNGRVVTLAYAGGTVYLGGEFTSVRPPGAPAGTGEVPRKHIAAFDAATGELLPFSHDMGSPPSVLLAVPDQGRLYVGGDFNTVDGVSRSKLAAFDLATGALTGWAPRAFNGVRGMAIHGDTIYLGGNFSAINGATRTRLAAVTAGTGAVLPWAPTADATVLRLAVAPGGGKVFAGGYFSNLNGTARRGTGSLDADTGAALPWASADVLPPHSSACTSDIRDIRVDDQNVYFAAEGTGGGCFDGTFAARQSDGALVWKNDCLGATQAIEIIGQFLYKGSHAHDCSAEGSFPERPQNDRRHLLVQKLSDGSLGPWYPNTSGNPLGPYAFATDGQSLFVGGDFLNVNNQAQQGFTRFMGSDPANSRLPRQPGTPRVTSTSAGKVMVTWEATTDDDDENLIYRVYRDGSQTPLYTSPVVRSTFWLKPNLSFVDSGLTPGTTHSYKVDAKEANGPNKSQFKSTAASVTVAGANATYASTIKGDGPQFHWRLGESSGTTAADASGNGRTGMYRGSVSLRQAGAIARDSNTAVGLATTSSLNREFVTSAGSFADPRTFSVELWFKTTTKAGGKLIGLGNSQTGTSTRYDRHVYMANDGRLVFGAFTGTATAVTSTKAYNNGAWHHLVATMGGDGMKLYVDGALVGGNPNALAQIYTGWWRVGGDNLNGWPLKPTSRYFTGTVDEAAVYGDDLTAEQVAEHFARAH